MNEIKQKIKTIIEANPDLRELSQDWSMSYNKRADMVFMGANFPENTFYVPVDENMMIRVDKDNKIHGFAIENAKSFIKKHPEFIPLHFVIYPYRSLFLVLPYYFVLYQTIRGINRMKHAFSVSENYIAGRVFYAN